MLYLTPCHLQQSEAASGKLMVSTSSLVNRLALEVFVDSKSRCTGLLLHRTQDMTAWFLSAAAGMCLICIESLCCSTSDGKTA